MREGQRGAEGMELWRVGAEEQRGGETLTMQIWSSKLERRMDSFRDGKEG